MIFSKKSILANKIISKEEDIRSYEEFIPILLYKNNLLSLLISKLTITPKIADIIARVRIGFAYLIPNHLKTRKIMMKYIQNKPLRMRRVPIWLQSTKMAIVVASESTLQHVPNRLKTPEVIKDAISRDCDNVKYIPRHLMTQEIAMEAVSVSCRRYEYSKAILDYIPRKMITIEMVKLIVSARSALIRFMPRKFVTPEIQMIAVRKKVSHIFYIRDPSREVIMFAIENDKKAMNYIHASSMTPDIIEVAIEHSRDAVKYIPKHMLNTEQLSLRRKIRKEKLMNRKIKQQ